MCGGRGQRTVRSQSACACESEQQEADILDSGKNQQALEAALREHEKRSDQRR